jgi:hypothetical protein
MYGTKTMWLAATGAVVLLVSAWFIRQEAVEHPFMMPAAADSKGKVATNPNVGKVFRLKQGMALIPVTLDADHVQIAESLFHLVKTRAEDPKTLRAVNLAIGLKQASLVRPGDRLRMDAADGEIWHVSNLTHREQPGGWIPRSFLIASPSSAQSSKTPAQSATIPNR